VGIPDEGERAVATIQRELITGKAGLTWIKRKYGEDDEKPE